MLTVIEFTNEKKYMEDFLKLPPLLYSKKHLVQNFDDEKKLLEGKHVLSRYFTLRTFLAYDGESPCARCILTLYPGDNTGYLGFFECVDNHETASAIFAAAEQCALKCGIRRIVGPVDSSFWIRYRLKISGFESHPYVSEPNNLEYYQNLFEQCGYTVWEQYVSNRYGKFPLFHYEQKNFRKHYDDFIQKGYQIVSPRKKDWDKIIGEIYQMISEVYCNFPVYKAISKEDFQMLFKNYKYILDFSMVKIAYFQGRAVGFFISVPDYQNRLVGKITLPALIYVLLKKIRSSNYIMLYLGVLPEHLGLGGALTHTLIKNVHDRNAGAVGALIHKGKVTQGYVKGRIREQYEYILLEKTLP